MNENGFFWPEVYDEPIAPAQLMLRLLQGSVETIPLFGALVSNLVFGLSAELLARKEHQAVVEAIGHLLALQSRNETRLSQLFGMLAERQELAAIAPTLRVLGNGQLPADATVPVADAVTQWREAALAERFRAERIRISYPAAGPLVAVAIAISANVARVPLLGSLRQRLSDRGDWGRFGVVVPSRLRRSLGLEPGGEYWRGQAIELLVDPVARGSAGLSFHPSFAVKREAPPDAGESRILLDLDRKWLPASSLSIAVRQHRSAVRVAVEDGSGREALRFSIRRI